MPEGRNTSASAATLRRYSGGQARGVGVDVGEHGAVDADRRVGARVVACSAGRGSRAACASPRARSPRSRARRCGRGCPSGRARGAGCAGRSTSDERVESAGRVCSSRRKWNDAVEHARVACSPRSPWRAARAPASSAARSPRRPRGRGPRRGRATATSGELAGVPATSSAVAVTAWTSGGRRPEQPAQAPLHSSRAARSVGDEPLDQQRREARAVGLAHRRIGDRAVAEPQLVAVLGVRGDREAEAGARSSEGARGASCERGLVRRDHIPPRTTEADQSGKARRHARERPVRQKRGRRPEAPTPE